MAIKLLHTSDLHIDWLFSKFNPQARKVRRKELIQVLDIIANLAIDEKVDGVMVCGDLFHSNRIDKHSLVEVWLRLEKMTNQGIKVFLLPGNHDNELADAIATLGEANSDIFVFAKELNYLQVIPGLHLYGMAYDSSNRIPFSQLNKRSEKGFHVAMAHGTVKSMPMIKDNYGLILPEELAACGMDYVALGHYHNLQDCSTGTVQAFYCGSPNTLSFDNTGERYVNLIELSDGEVKVTPINMPTRPYKLVECNVTGKTLADIYREVEAVADAKACVKIILKGIIDFEIFPLAIRLQEQFADRFFHLEIDEGTVLLPDVDHQDQTIKGIFIRKIHERLNSPELDDEQRVIVLEALRVGLTAIEGRKLG